MTVLSLRHPIELKYLGEPADLKAAVAEANASLCREGISELRVCRDRTICLSLDAAAISGLTTWSDRAAAFQWATERLVAVLGGHPFELAPPEGSRVPTDRALPLYVAINAGCNLKCWYCTEFGENRGFEQPGLSMPRLIELLRNAHDAGYRTFRFTGGEPTNRPDLAEILVAAQSIDSDVRIAITTNGAHLDRILPILPDLIEPRIFLSVDGLAPAGAPPSNGEFRVAKWLTTDLMKVMEKARQHSYVRFNFVLTRSSREELWPFLEHAMRQGIDVKLFELLLRDFFFAHGRPKTEVFAQQYVSIREVIPQLLELGERSPFPGLGGRGIPMSQISTGSNRIIFFDSLVGSHYSVKHCHGCDHFPCQEGLYAPLLNASGTLHPAGCRNTDLHARIAHAEATEAKAAFDSIRMSIHRSKLENEVPAEVQRAVSRNAETRRRVA